MRCSLIDKTLAWRSTKTAMVVGTLLVGLNQGDILLRGEMDFPSGMFKIALTYLVPFCVSTYSALANGYRPQQS